VSFVPSRRWRASLLALLAVTLVVPSVAGADRRDGERHDAAERQRALVAEIDALTASDEELVAAIETLNGYVDLKVVEVSQAQDVLAQAYVAADAARRAEAEKRAEIALLEDQMAAMAVAAYVAPPQADRMETMLSATAPGDAASLDVYLDVQNGRDTDLVRQLRTARAELGDQRRIAEEAEARAESAHDRAVTELSDLLEARQQQEEIHAAVVARLGEASQQSDVVSLHLGDLNASLLESARAVGGAHVPVTTVRGIRVHTSIATQVDALLEAAERDGIVLRGGGLRSHDEQIALRRAHCGGDDHYSIWERPAGECSPPTAVPGTSLHELGLAIDFTYRGTTIASHASPAFQWLQENASRFGLYNLPSEPWHWSVNGT
jgi:LAS superfamily LD-carboxypeptidase LdcB